MSSDLSAKKVGFVGCGKMAEAMCRGLMESGLIKPENLMGSCRGPETMKKIVEKLGIKGTHNNAEVVQASDVVFLAVKPHQILDMLREVSSVIDTSRHLLVSVAAGITISTMEQVVPKSTKIIWAMPNTPCLVRKGATVWAPNSYCTQSDYTTCQTLLESFGIAAQVLPHEIDNYVGLSGSGPAYIFMAIEALADGGVKNGIPRDKALKFAAQMVSGAAEMALQTGLHPGILKDQVCSPGGTTICAVASLERDGFRNSLINAVEASSTKAKQIGLALKNQ